MFFFASCFHGTGDPTRAPARDPRVHRLALIAVLVAACPVSPGAFAQSTAPVAPASDGAPTRTLGVVTVTGSGQPTSLPTQIPADDGERHARADRADDQRHRQRGRAQVPSEPARAQALHRRLQPRDPVEPRLGHRQQRALGGLCRWHAALELPRQRRRRPELSAALGHGHARGDRARRRDVRPVLGRLPGQLGRRGGRLHDADAEGARGARQGRLHEPAVSALRHRLDLSRLGDQRLGRQPERRPLVVAGLQPLRQPWPAAHVRDAAARAAARQCRRHAGHRGGARTPTTPAAPGTCSAPGPSTRRSRTTSRPRLAYDITPTIRANYLLGCLAEHVGRTGRCRICETPHGHAVYSGRVNIDGLAYTGRRRSPAATSRPPTRS